MYKPGDVIELGSFVQDVEGCEARPIRWRVLTVDDGRALVVSVHALDRHQFNEDIDDGNDWENSDLKSWLEGDFSDAAFSASDLQRIDGKPFCLSVDEVERYFDDDADRVCTPTAYAKARGVYTRGSNACPWWLRSPGDDSYSAAFVGRNGYIDSYGSFVDIDDIAVRPALWVKL